MEGVKEKKEKCNSVHLRHNLGNLFLKMSKKSGTTDLFIFCPIMRKVEQQLAKGFKRTVLLHYVRFSLKIIILNNLSIYYCK